MNGTEGFTRLACSMCPTGYYFVTKVGNAECDTCGHAVDIVLDVMPHLDDGEFVSSYVDTYVNIVRQEEA